MRHARKPWAEVDRQPWSAWLETWATHAQTGAFRARMDSALDVLSRARAIPGQLFCAVSGGKDSIAVAALLAEAGWRLPCVHCATELNIPDMESVAARACEQLGLELTVAEPELDIWEWLRDSYPSQSIMDGGPGLEFRNQFSSGNMLVAAMYAAEYAGSVSGMRAEESRGRRMNRIVRGPIYRQLVDETWMVLPIVDWTARDVFALAVSRGLPISEHYRKLLEKFLISPESPASRVDCVLTEDKITARGAMVHLRVLYPNLWSRLVSLRPELMKET